MKKLIALLTSASLAFSGLAWAGGGGPQPGVNSPWNPVWSIPIDSLKYTYGIGAELSPLSGATDLFQLCGAASTVTRVTRIAISGRATAVSPMPVFIVKRSTADNSAVATYAPQTPFLSGTVHGIAYDSNASTSTATASAWATTAGSLTLGTTVGVIAAGLVYLGNATTGTSSNPPLLFEFGNRPDSAAILRSASECLAINLSNGSYLGNLIDVQVEWTEE